MKRQLQRSRATVPANLPVPAQAWLWVTRTVERDPHDEGWWSCHPNTRAGELALIYLTAPAKKIAYLARAETDAAPVDPDSTVPSTTGFECSYAILARLPTPIAFSTLTQDSQLPDWPALRSNFIGSAHRTPTDVWDHLLKMASITPRRVATLITARTAQYRLEWELEEYLVAHPEAWERLRLKLELKSQQRRFSDGSRADLVYRTRTGRMVVVELKRGAIDQKAVDQVRRYQECLHREQPRWRRPLGIVVGEPPERVLRSAIRRARRLRYVDVADLGLSRTGTPF